MKEWEKYFTDKGYEVKRVFDGEYTLMTNDITFRRVRLYDNGLICEYNHYTGGYMEPVNTENFKPLK